MKLSDKRTKGREQNIGFKLEIYEQKGFDFNLTFGAVDDLFLQ